MSHKSEINQQYVHCVQKKTPTDSFFHISMNNVSI